MFLIYYPSWIIVFLSFDIFPLIYSIYNILHLQVSNETRKDKVVCKCNHFTSFGSDFFVAPNPIDFDKVFSADVSDNPVVLSVVVGLFGLYLILVVFARRADKRDEKKVRPVVFFSVDVLCEFPIYSYRGDCFL